MHGCDQTLLPCTNHLTFIHVYTIVMAEGYSKHYSLLCWNIQRRSDRNTSMVEYLRNSNVDLLFLQEVQ